MFDSVITMTSTQPIFQLAHTTLHSKSFSLVHSHQQEQLQIKLFLLHMFYNPMILYSSCSRPLHHLVTISTWLSRYSTQALLPFPALSPECPKAFAHSCSQATRSIIEKRARDTEKWNFLTDRLRGTI